MKKPFNKVSLLLLLVLVVVLGLDADTGWIKYNHFLNGVDGPESVLEVGVSAILHAAYLAGLATLIEIADRIRWDLKNRG